MHALNVTVVRDYTRSQNGGTPIVSLKDCGLTVGQPVIGVQLVAEVRANTATESVQLFWQAAWTREDGQTESRTVGGGVALIAAGAKGIRLGNVVLHAPTPFMGEAGFRLYLQSTGASSWGGNIEFARIVARLLVGR